MAQVEALGYAIAGEKVPLDFVATAKDGASDISLSFSCRYREGSTVAAITLAESSPDSRQDESSSAQHPPGDSSKADISTSQMAESAQTASGDGQKAPSRWDIEGWKVAKKLSTGGVKRMRAWVEVPVKGQLHISASLHSTTDEVTLARALMLDWLHLETHFVRDLDYPHNRLSLCRKHSTSAKVAAQASICICHCVQSLLCLCTLACSCMRCSPLPCKPAHMSLHAHAC